MAALMQLEELTINAIQLKKGAMIIRAINHPLRQQILSLIHQEGRITVTQLYIRLRLEQSVVSQHLAILRKSGFVETQREGKFIYYKVDQDRLAYVQNCCVSLLTF